MPIYAIHRFSVGQRVTWLGARSRDCEVIALVDGPEGPEYRIKSSDGSAEAVVAERDLAYITRTNTNEQRRSLH